ncbi:PIG-P [Gorgonomyces haynaldii]|nr:PIG-P [Gorgonomyces haynaldii]
MRKESTREYYGFVLYLSSILLLLIYLFLVFVPDPILRSFHITYYPSKLILIGLPIWITGLIPFTIVVYTAHNLTNTPPPDSLLWMTEEKAPMMKFTVSNLDRIMNYDLIPHLEDVPLDLVNKCLN